MGNTAQLANLSGAYAAGGINSFKNRIINGAMVIDQRNAGAAVTVNSTSQFFPVDRWVGRGESGDGVFTVQQSSTAPTTFRNSIVATVTTADAAIGSSQRYEIYQRIEGNNIADLMWGTAAAQTVTLSFWVRSSVTGTFGGSLSNADNDRSYPFTYTISSANAWEQKSITIAGDTTGTWNTSTGIGIWVDFSLGAGASRLGTANAWAAGFYTGATGQTNLISTNGATFYITGVQLEKGSTATSFDYRPYGTELALCQRYYEKSYNIDVVPATNTYVGRATVALTAATSTVFDLSTVTSFKVTKRTVPSMQYWRQGGTVDSWLADGPAIGLGVTFNVITNTSSMTGFEVTSAATSGISGLTQYATYIGLGQWAASAEL